MYSGGADDLVVDLDDVNLDINLVEDDLDDDLVDVDQGCDRGTV